MGCTNNVQVAEEWLVCIPQKYEPDTGGHVLTGTATPPPKQKLLELFG